MPAPIVRDLILRGAEWRLRAHMPADRAAVLVGDLCEDYGKARMTRGPLRAVAWLFSEAWSMTHAYAQPSTPRPPTRGLALDNLLAELKHAVRRLLKRPTPTLTSILTMALGLGAGAATWSVINAVLIHPLPVASPDSLVVVSRQSDRAGGPADAWQLYTTYVAIRDRRAFEATAASGCLAEPIAAAGSDAAAGNACFVSGSYFDVLGVRPSRGRALSSADDQRGGPLVAVVSDAFWRTNLGADAGAIGRSVSVNGRQVTVIGVAPAAFRGLSLASAPDLYLPLETVAEIGNEASDNFFAKPIGRPYILSSPSTWISVIARIAPATTRADVLGKLQGIATASNGTAQPFVLTSIEMQAIPEAARAGMAMFTRLLGATVGLLLFVACLAVGMLLLVRTEARREEFAMCLALGATRGRLALGVALEAIILAVSGALLALPVSSWMLHGVRAFQLPGGIELRWLNLALDGNIVAATAALAAASVAVTTLIAAAFALKARSDEVVRARPGATPPIASRRARAFLVGSQVSVALVLVVGAGLFARSLAAALTLNPGFDTSRLVTANVNFPQYAFDPTRAKPLFDDLRSRLDNNPAIRSSSMTAWTGGMTSRGTVSVDGIPRHFPSMVSFTAIDERYFATVGLPILAGRDFTSHDRDGAPLVAIVSQSFGRQIASGGDPVGHTITSFHAFPGKPFPVIEVVGVVPDVVTNVTVLQPLVLYRPIAQEDPIASRTILLRGATDISGAVQETASALRAIDPTHGSSLGKIETIDQALISQLQPQQFGAVVLAALGGIAMLLAALGAYVLAESMSAVRLREMGIRAAMGASREQLVNLLLADTGRLVVAGLIVGLGIAWLGAGTIRSLLFQVQPLDPMTLVTAGAVILATTLIVGLGPALRAARVDLAGLLRSE